MVEAEFCMKTIRAAYCGVSPLSTQPLPRYSGLGQIRDGRMLGIEIRIAMRLKATS